MRSPAWPLLALGLVVLPRAAWAVDPLCPQEEVRGEILGVGPDGRFVHRRRYGAEGPHVEALDYRVRGARGESIALIETVTCEENECAPRSRAVRSRDARLGEALEGLIRELGPDAPDDALSAGLVRLFHLTPLGPSRARAHVGRTVGDADLGPETVIDLGASSGGLPIYSIVSPRYPYGAVEANALGHEESSLTFVKVRFASPGARKAGERWLDYEEVFWFPPDTLRGLRLLREAAAELAGGRAAKAVPLAREALVRLPSNKEARRLLAQALADTRADWVTASRELAGPEPGAYDDLDHDLARWLRKRSPWAAEPGLEAWIASRWWNGSKPIDPKRPPPYAWGPVRWWDDPEEKGEPDRATPEPARLTLPSLSSQPVPDRTLAVVTAPAVPSWVFELIVAVGLQRLLHAILGAGLLARTRRQAPAGERTGGG